MSPFRHVSEDRNETGPTGACSASLLPEAYQSGSAPAMSSFRSHSTIGHSHGSTQRNPASVVQRSVSAITSRQHNHRGVMINGIVGNGISGILYKWVNYGRGWRARWFVLQDGVLSYFKIHGPNKLVLNREVERGSMVIGEESLRRIASHRNNPSRQRKPVCEIHLMVCSIRESKSDERRFSMKTGTKKRLHLRAESREDRDAWVEALKAVKGLYPRSPKNAEIMAPHETMLMSTQKLRQRLLEEGVSEIAIQESENIMRSELVQMHKHIMALKQKQKLLLDSLRHLEAKKVDLENTLVNETQRQSKVGVGGSLTSKHGKFSDGSPSDSSDDQYRHDQSDDDNDAFFDTSDILSLSSCRENESDSDCEETSTETHDVNSLTARSNYPLVTRRKKLPDPVEKEKAASLWSIIKDNIGKDLTSVCLPVYFNEPLSSLQKCCEDLEYSYLLDRAFEWGQKGNSLMRVLEVAAFAVSGYSSTLGRSCKPFNPLLGETYEADFPDKGFRFISEKVSHHPMVVACHCEGGGWKFWGDGNLKSKFRGRSIQLDPVGLLTVEFDDGEVVRWSKVTTSIYNLILGKLYCDHYGTMRIEGNCEYSCKLKFKEQSIMDRNPHQVQGVVEDKNAKTVATICGKWDESLHCIINDNSKRKKSSGSSKPCLLWKRNEPPVHLTRYNFTEFAVALNEITPGLREKLPPTDSRLRPDQRFLENGEYEMANTEKLRLEQRQRQARRMQEKGWKPRWFVKDKEGNGYRYAGGYWEAREKGIWDSCPDIFCQIPNETDPDPTSPS
ncbi:oxysterol-binding protein-related protein 1B-like isoform X2 [Prosopis cineraria]|uniref:oxysterol-binding protein-related protein 1B-like isoform X2 n=1 Tax=Prosopis cineraria TaxID=364024 RepID=UPI00240F5463|nr:oxysterol-binding protein-related protein 1B-like isoform X2 [Prosopis cineraria]